jgi:putative ABC transport system ATP-binding protein
MIDMLEIYNLRFAYPGDGFCLQVEELTVAAGERVAWVGPSGSGKTTLLNMAAGIVLPAAGELHCCGVKLTDLGEAARRDFRIANVGLVFQDFALLDYLTVIDNILLPYRINRSLRLTEQVRDRADELAQAVGLAEFLIRRPEELSQGERQRVAVCRALVTGPKLVLADEPTANLDEENGGRVMDALERHAQEQGATLVVVTHDAEVKERMQRVIDVSAFCLATQAAGGAANGQ